MNSKAKRLLSWLCVLALCMSLLPVTALAAGDGSSTTTVAKDSVTESQNGVTVNKSVSQNVDGSYQLTMEAYASNVVTTESKTTPLDIVLVLDQSGSMADTFSGNQTRQAAMKTAVKNFIDSVAKQYSDESNHQMAIVTFDNNASALADWTAVNSQGKNGLESVIDNLSSRPEGATNVAAGMEEAQDLLEDKTGNNNRQQVVIVFTDGVPTTSNEFNTSVANQALTIAKGLKDDGVSIYTIGIFAGANPSELYGASGFDTNSDGTVNSSWKIDEWGLFPGTDFPEADRPAANRFLNYLSSNYLDAEEIGLRRDTEGLGILHSAITYTITRNFTYSNDGYYLTAENSEGLNVVFQKIFDEINSLQVCPDATAVLTDTLSQYFNFPSDLTEGNVEVGSDVTAQYVPVESIDGDTITWGKAEDLPKGTNLKVTVQNDTINIEGFDYYENAVTQEDGKYSGGKLVVSFPIELDAAECRYQGGIYPTNDIGDNKAGLHYKDKQGAPQNNESTLLDKSPEVTVDASQVERQGTAIDIKVYVDGQAMSESEKVSTYVNVTPKDSGSFDEETDKVNYTFTYYDCKDIDFAAQQGYVIEAVDADLVYGQSECKGITDNNGTVTADNVRGGSTVIVYVRTVYQLVYHNGNDTTTVPLVTGKTANLSDNVQGQIGLVNSSRPTTGKQFTEEGQSYNYVNVCSTSDKHYIDNNDDGTCDEHAAATADGKQQAYDFTYVADLTTSETIDPLPVDKTGEMVYDGWFVGNTNTGAQKISAGVNVSNGHDYNFETMDAADGATDNVINLYCTSSAAQYKVTYKLTSTDNPSDASTLPADNQYRYDETVSVAADLTTWETSNDGVPGTWTFSGWTTNDVTVTDGVFKMPAQNVEFTGSWTFTANPTYTVSYQVSGDAPAAFSPDLDGLGSQQYENNTVQVAEGLTTEETSKDGVSGTWTFNGWTTDDVEVDDGAFTMPGKDVTFTGSWTFTPNTHTITVEVTNGTAQAEELNDGTSTTKGTITVNDNGSVTITFTGNDGYALDTVTVDDSPAVLTTNNEDGSTTYTFSNVKADHNISVVYEEDKIGTDDPDKGDGIPDEHQATVTYNVVNGTFGENGPTTKSYVVTTEEYQTTGEDAGTWTSLNKYVGDSECPIPTDMTPDSNHVKPGTWGEPKPSNAVQLVGGQTYTYTYTFGTEVEKSLSVTKELTQVDGKTYNGSGIVDEGSELTYTITVTNTGNVTLTDIVVTDTLTINDEAAEVTLEYNGTDTNVTINDDGTATIDSLGVTGSVTLTATYTVPEGTAGQKISNTAVATSGDTTGEPENPVEVTVANPDVEITKALTSATRPGDEGFNYDSDTYKAQVGDELHYTITVKNTGNTHIKVDVTDSLWGNGVNTVYIGGDTTGTPVADGGPVTIAMLPEKESQTITYTYTVQASDIGKQNISNTAIASTGTEEDDPKDDDTVNVPMDTYTVTITPADITIYTGGDGYGGVTNESGAIIDGTEASGLPEPGYHIELPAAVVNWLAEQGIIASGSNADDVAANLSEYLTFTYDYNNQTRDWSMGYAGIYSTNETTGEPTRYVYTLNPAKVEDKEIPVRLLYKNSANEVVSDDEITMGENLVSDKFSMTINPGELDQSQIKAKLTVGEDGNEQSISCNINIEPGELTVRSVVDKDDNTNAIAADQNAVTNTETVTAVANGEVTYYVNDSEVQVENKGDRVQLLVDDVSNSPDFNKAMGEDAVAKVNAKLGEGNTLSNATYDLAYMDLVDTQNGNAVVTMGEEDSLTLYWPVPEDAAANSEFHVVHYTGMDRENVVSTDELSEAAHTSPDASVVDVNGEKYVTFETSSFSPFALVYEKAPDPVASLDVTKTLTAVNGKTPGSSVSVGDTLTYTITVTNNGNVDLTNVTVTDTMSNGRTVTWVNLPDGVTNTDGTLTIASLTVGTSVELTATYKVLRADANSNLVNTVKVTGTNPGDPDTPVTDEETTPETPVNPYHPPIRPPEDPDKPELNTEDHYAYIVGYPDGTVRPEGNITRAEVATIFFRLLTDDSRDEFWSQTNPYSDVSADDWYNNAVSTLTNAGILDGYEDGTFRPNGNITRAEFATITARFFDATYEGEDLFPDIDGHWAQDYINESANAGIVNGYEDGTFRPQKLITRAEAMTMVNRTIERHPDAEHLLDDMITWPDNLETAWYYEQVQEATNSHTYTMHTDAEKNPYEIWSELLPVRDWAQLEKEWSDAHSGQTGGEVV